MAPLVKLWSATPIVRDTARNLSPCVSELDKDGKVMNCANCQAHKWKWSLVNSTRMAATLVNEDLRSLQADLGQVWDWSIMRQLFGRKFWGRSSGRPVIPHILVSRETYETINHVLRLKMSLCSSILAVVVAVARARARVNIEAPAETHRGLFI